MTDVIDTNEVPAEVEVEESADVVTADFDDVVDEIVEELDSAKEVEGAKEEEVVAKTEDTTLATKAVPYDRFKEVNDAKNRLEAELEQLRSSARQTDVKPKDESPKSSADVFPILDAEQLKGLKEANPQLYEAYLLEKRERDLVERLEVRQQELLAKKEQEAARLNYVKHHEGEVFKEFPDAKNPDSAWFKEVAPKIQEMAKDIPAIAVDPAVWKLGLKVLALEKKLATSREQIRKELETEMHQKRADKKSAALTGQASAIPGKRSNTALDDFEGSPSWEK